MHQENAFITLTYDDDHLESPSLNHRDFQLFMKRLRKSIAAKEEGGTGRPSPAALAAGKKISYYMAGEYGTDNRRPHYHACIFGWRPKDLENQYVTGTSEIYYSKELDKLWGKGFTSVGDVTFESAAYIARYIMAKITGQQAEEHYQHIEPSTGEIVRLKPEYNRMSLNPAIGKRWLDKYETDVYPQGEVLTRNIKTKSPKYYDKQYKKNDKQKFKQGETDNTYDQLKADREQKAAEHAADNTDERLKAKQTVKMAQIKSLTRKL